MTQYNFEEIIPKFDKILERGLCSGVGSPYGQMCVEAAITQAMGLPFNDEPECVTKIIRLFKIEINDKDWSSPQARAKALRNIGIAQIGTKGIVNGQEFLIKLTSKIIQVLIPSLFKDILPNQFIGLVNQCEINPTQYNCGKLAQVALAADYAANAADYAAAKVAHAAAQVAQVAQAAANAANNIINQDKYLILCVDLALEVLRELGSPGCEYV